MRGSAIARYSFTGHETFPFRYSWPTKAVHFVQAHSDLFTRDDALVLLGVGKNMVVSMRHWADALGLIERTEIAGHMRPTLLGEALLGHNGWDPYLENPGTLWLLHWQLVHRIDRASTWHLAFTKWHTEGFSRDKLADWLWRTAQELGSSSSTIASINRDVDVFVRTYVPAITKRDAPIEDSFDCPLVELGLIREIERGLYRFVRGSKPTLPDDIFLSALLAYWQTVAPDQQTLTFESVLHGAGSPGAAFKLSENALAERLEALPMESGMQFDETAGMRQLLMIGTPPTPFELLEQYYKSTLTESELAVAGAHSD